MGTAMFMLADDGRLQVFEASGAVAAAIFGAEYRKPLAKDEARIYQDDLIKLAERTAKDLATSRLAADEEFRFERLWRMKAQGVTFKGERSAVALLQVTGAFRRYVQGLPVLGAAHRSMSPWAGLMRRSRSGGSTGGASVVRRSAKPTSLSPPRARAERWPICSDVGRSGRLRSRTSSPALCN